VYKKSPIKLKEIFGNEQVRSLLYACDGHIMCVAEINKNSYKHSLSLSQTSGVLVVSKFLCLF